MENNLISRKNNQPLDFFLGMVVLIIVGLVSPFILILIVKFTGFSEIVEEIFKALIVYFLILRLYSFRQKIGAGFIFGLLFALSESFLYLNNIFQIGEFAIFWQRLFLTTLMHILTVLVVLFSGLKSKKYIIFGIVCAIIIHLFFNQVV